MRVALLSLVVLAGCSQQPAEDPCKDQPNTVRDPAKCHLFDVSGSGINSGAGPATTIVQNPDGSVTLK